ncbi:MAG: hypothetical protein WBK77_07440 [Alphaproteobacteria bacterium]
MPDENWANDPKKLALFYKKNSGIYFGIIVILGFFVLLHPLYIYQCWNAFANGQAIQAYVINDHTTYIAKRYTCKFTYSFTHKDKRQESLGHIPWPIRKMACPLIGDTITIYLDENGNDYYIHGSSGLMYMILIEFFGLAMFLGLTALYHKAKKSFYILESNKP